MVNLKNIPLSYKILLGVIVVIVLAIVVKPNVAKKLYKRLIGEYDIVDDKLAKELDDLKTKRYNDSIYYEDALKQKDMYYKEELSNAIIKYNTLKLKLKRHEQELDAYRNADFDDKFELFTRAIIGKDTIQR